MVNPAFPARRYYILPSAARCWYIPSSTASQWYILSSVARPWYIRPSTARRWYIVPSAARRGYILPSTARRKQTNACWSIPRSQTVFIHLKIRIRYAESEIYEAFVVVQCPMLGRPAAGTDILFFRVFSSIRLVGYRMKNVIYLICITIFNT